MDPTAAVCTPLPPAGPDGATLHFPPEWLTEPVRSLAHGIRTDDAFDIMPVLADALEEAGCDDPRVLDHCRFCEDHRPDCWVIESILPSDQLYWSGAVEDRFAATVAEAARQGDPDDPDADEREAARRERKAVRMMWGCAALVAALSLLGFLVSQVRR